MFKLTPLLCTLCFLLSNKHFFFLVSAAKSCPADVIPGIERMARGIDITRLDLNTLQDDAFVATLIEFSCEDEDRKWSMGGVDKEFWKTDQVVGANPVPGGSMVSETIIAESSEELKNSMAAKVSLEVNVPIGGFSASAGVKMSEESKFQKKSFVAEVNCIQNCKLKTDNSLIFAKSDHSICLRLPSGLLPSSGAVALSLQVFY